MTPDEIQRAKELCRRHADIMATKNSALILLDSLEIWDFIPHAIARIEKLEKTVDRLRDALKDILDASDGSFYAEDRTDIAKMALKSWTKN